MHQKTIVGFSQATSLSDFIPPDLLFDVGADVWAQAAFSDNVHSPAERFLERKDEVHKVVKSRVLELNNKIYVASFFLFSADVGAEKADLLDGKFPERIGMFLQYGKNCLFCKFRFRFSFSLGTPCRGVGSLY